MRTLKKFSKMSLLLVSMLVMGVVLAACGESTTTTNASPNSFSGLKATGYNSALASSFPATTSVYLTLNTNENSDQAKSWNNMVTYLSNVPGIKDAMGSTDLTKSLNMGDFEKDIKPWLGNELAIGITDFEALAAYIGGLSSLFSSNFMGNGDSANATPTTKPATPASTVNPMSLMGKEVPLLVALQIKDKDKAEAFIKKTLDSGSNSTTGSSMGLGNMKPTTETYKDYNIYNLNLFVIQLSVAVGKDKLFLGLGPKLVKDAIDQNPTSSLTSNKTYANVASKLPDSNLGFAYVDAAAAVKGASSLSSLMPSTGTTKTTMPSMNLDYVNGMGFSFAAADEGLRVDVYQSYNESKLTPELKKSLGAAANGSSILSALPEKTIFFANGKDAKSAYDQFNTTMAQLPADQSKSVKDGIAKFESETGLSIQKDLVSLFAGEFAIFGTSLSANAATASMPIGVGLLTAVTDKAATQASLDKIAATLEKSQDATVKFETKTSGGVTYKSANITGKDGKTTTLDLGIAGNYAFVSTATEQTEAIIAASANGANFTKGAGYAEFTKSKSYLPDSNQGYMYADMQQLLTVAKNSANSNSSASSDKTLKALEGLTQLKSVSGASKSSTTESFTTVFIHFPVMK